MTKFIKKHVFTRSEKYGNASLFPIKSLLRFFSEYMLVSLALGIRGYFILDISLRIWEIQKK